ncbi:hypothetical protein K488DRAFT_91763 [Vararia minispora EC-137]|uniref:Uncharacterized protein n=1 Tax=Vararia minispora EC-137 TaxID=1314806 RepID=A0ACB8Q563_9AGAM|nr:hypothetical protein K488DRAFT_91763 [Vararia minispora EC-137]
MAIDESILRDCLKHLLTLCYAEDPLEWPDRFRRQIDAWHRISAEERYARFYASRRAMAGLTQERDLILRQGAHAWRVATERGHAVLDGRE